MKQTTRKASKEEAISIARITYQTRKCGGQCAMAYLSHRGGRNEESEEIS